MAIRNTTNAFPLIMKLAQKTVLLQTFVSDVLEVAMICDSKSVSFCYAVYCSVYSAAKSFGCFFYC